MSIRRLANLKGPQRAKLLICLVLGLLLYVYYLSGLTTNPPGFYVDESAVSYSAYSIYESGKDEFGHVMPLYFPVFPLAPPFDYLGYVEPVQIYSLAALFFVFPPSLFLARALSATAIFLAVILIGLLARRISGRDSVGIIVGLIAFFTPWLFEIGRLAFSASLYPLTIALLLTAVYRAYRKDRWSWPDMCFIALSLGLTCYTYAIGRLLGPLLALGLILLVTNLRRLWSVLATWGLFALTMVPMLVFHLRHPGALAGRYRMTVGYYAETKSYSDLFTEFLAHVWENVSLWRLVMTGDPNLRHHVMDVGSFLAVPLFLALVGIIVIAIRHWREAWWRFVIYGLLVSVIPASLTKDPFHSLRLAAFPVFLLVLMIPTLMWLTDGWRRGDQAEQGESKRRLLGNKPFRTVTLALLLLLTAAHAGYFLYKFHNYGPDRGGYFDYNFPPVFAKALEQPDRPIYLVDQFYYHVMWQAIVQGVDRSNFVRLLPYNRPPANSIILSGEERCSECEVLYKDIPFILYKTHVGPPKQPEQVKSNKGSEPGQYSKPRGLTEDKDGNYYIADTDNGRVEKFDLNGKFISTFGTLGSGEGEMKEPNGVAVDNSGNSFVTDALNHKLLKFDANGAFVKEWKGPDTGFYGPRDLAFGPNGQLYIIDQGRTRVVIMDTANETFSVWGTMGSADGQLNDPYGIDVSDDKVFVTDLGNNRVQVFDLSGKFIRQWPVPQWEHTALSRPDIIYDSENKRAYVTNTKDKAVLVFDAEGNALEPIKPEPPAELNNPSALVLSTAGGLKHLLVLNTGGDLPGSGEPSVSTILVPSSPTQKPQPKRK